LVVWITGLGWGAEYMNESSFFCLAPRRQQTES
jgi:hypothetical protein